MRNKRVKTRVAALHALTGSVRSLLAPTEPGWRSVARPDLVLLSAVLILLILGIDMVYSASFIVAYNSPQYQSDTYFLTRQVLWVIGGLVGMVVALRVDYRHWRRLSVPLVAIVLILLLAGLLTSMGYEAYGAQRWFRLGPLPAIQPSEFAKLAVVVYLSAWLASRPGRAASFTHGAIPFALMIGTIGGLILAGSDLGSAFIVVVVGACLFFIGGADVRHFLAGVLAGAAALVAAVLVAGYRSDRLQAFRDPTGDPLGIGWQTIQTNIALGSGGIFGLGLGASRQKFYWLPAAHTDSIFAVIGEELGLVGTLLVVALFVLLGYRGYKAMMAAPDEFGRLLAGGITIWITLQAAVNMAAVTSLIPFTGVPLPFVSYGGSSTAATLVAVGILLNISRHRDVRRAAAGGRPGAVAGRLN